ncbi:MAG: ATPase [Oscillospiraceae bacterium]|nr:ATPase [Oscillospiraceae bacterium]
MNIETILDHMDDVLDKAWSLPLSGGRCVVDVERMRDLVDEMRISLPNEITQAKMMLADRAEILAGAKREGDEAIRRAEGRAKSLIAQEAIVKQAQQKAADIMAEAQIKSREVRQGAFHYSDDALRSTEEVLTKALGELRTTRAALRSSAKQK